MINYALAVLVQAIPVTPTPDAPLSSEQLRFLDALADRFQQVAAADSTTVNFAVVIIGIGFLLFMASVFIAIVWVARGGLNSFFGMVKDANRRAEDAEDGKDKATETVERELERRRKVDEQQLETSKANVETLIALKDSINNPIPRLKPVIEAVSAAVTEQHETTRAEITREHEATRKIVKTALERLDKMEERIGGVDETLKKSFTELREDLRKLFVKEAIEAVAATPPAKTPFAERGSMGEVESAEKG